MKVYDAASIRNVAVVGHGGSGKTQLVSALLFDAGMVNRLGKVDEGNTVTDYDEEEISRKHTLSASLAYAEWNKTKINLIDTPGFGNFFSDARAAIQVADAALIVVDAVAGVEVQTEKAWAACEELQLPRLIVVNRLDRERASLERTLDSLRLTLNRTIIPIQLPIGEERNFTGVIDLVSMKAYTYAGDGSGKVSEGAVPGNLADEANLAREALIEMVAEADETLMEKFFDAGTLTQEELIKGLATATRAAKLYPLVCTSGLSNIGAQPLMDAILAYLPSPAERPFTAAAGNDKVSKPADDKAPYAAFVWKTVADQFAGRITMFRVYQGCLKADSTVQNATQGAAERLGHLIVMQGKTPTNVPELKAGDIGAVAKLKDTRTNDTLADKAAAITFQKISFPEPVLSYAIEPKSRGDEDKISTAMHRLEEEDPTIKYHRDPQTHELLLAGQGQMHIEVTVAKLKRRFGVEVNLKPPRIPYRETITARVEAHGRHKKQTGGHGQFGDCKIKMEPLPRGSEFEFVDEIFGGAIPRGFIPAVEKGIQESRLRGYLAGYPVVDFRVTLFDGSYHDVDSNELSFKTA
ncbi:MAG TPA: elongation factor G, partial [Vicinamibacterales bacterium]